MNKSLIFLMLLAFTACQENPISSTVEEDVKITTIDLGNGQSVMIGESQNAKVLPTLVFRCGSLVTPGLCNKCLSNQIRQIGDGPFIDCSAQCRTIDCPSAIADRELVVYRPVE